MIFCYFFQRITKRKIYKVGVFVKFMRKTNVLKDAQDFIVIGQAEKDSYVYAAKPSLNIMKQFYEKSMSNPSDTKVPVFQEYWKFDEQIGIKGSSTFLALRFDKSALRPNGLWIPGLLETEILNDKGKLENKVYRDYGIVGFNENGPNREIAGVLIPQAKKLELELPLIIPFRALDYVPHRDKKLPIGINLVESPTGVIQGKEAQNKIDSLDFQRNLGVQRLLRSGSVTWSPVGLDVSDGYGRVDWVCGKSTLVDLERANKLLLEREYSSGIRKLEKQKKKKQAEFAYSLEKDF